MSAVRQSKPTKGTGFAQSRRKRINCEYLQFVYYRVKYIAQAVAMLLPEQCSYHGRITMLNVQYIMLYIIVSTLCCSALMKQ